MGGISMFAREYKDRGMAAYVQMIQRKEREHGVETLTHQKWSGSEIVDSYLNTITGGTASTSIMGAGVTESQFGAAKRIPQTESLPAAGFDVTCFGKFENVSISVIHLILMLGMPHWF